MARDQQEQRPVYKPQHNGEPPPIPPLPPELGSARNQSLNLVGPSQQGFPEPPPKPPKASDSTSKYDKPAPLPPVSHHPQQFQSQHRMPSPQQASRHTLVQPPYDQHVQLRADDLHYQQGRGQPSSHSVQSGRQPNQGSRSPVSPMDGYLPPATHQNSGYNPQKVLPQQHQLPDPSGRQSQWRQPAGYKDPQGIPQTPQQMLYQQYPAKTAQPPKPKPPKDLLTSPFETAFPAPVTNVAPPPIPPNPQKDALLSAISDSLTQQIQSIHASNTSAITPLHAQQAALRSTLDAVGREISQLNDLEQMLTSNEAILHQAMHDADKVLEDAKRRKVPNVDDVLVAPTVVAGQLYQAVAEERAIEDCRGVLGKALDKGRIAGGVWAKQTRSLAREEFLKKTLIKKISRGMALAEERPWQ